MNGTHEPCNPPEAIQQQIDVELIKIGIQSRLDKCIEYLDSSVRDFKKQLTEDHNGAV